MGETGPRDFRGSPRLTGRAEWVWYVAAAGSYIALGMFHKFLLNWFVGPLWLVVVIVAGPAIGHRFRRPRNHVP